MLFSINNIPWEVVFVSPYDEILRKPDGTFTIGVTDRETQTIYISYELYGELLRKVISHEVCHSAIFSYDYDMDIPDEECLCDVLATHGAEVDFLTDRILEEI